MNMYMDHPCSKEKQMERLQLLLLRVHTVVEEADGRYITNSGMLLQLKMLVETMYSGYDALDSVKCHQLINEVFDEHASGSLPFYISTPLKRLRTLTCKSKHRTAHSDLKGALQNLDNVLSSITEFVVLLGGCERMSCRPYDTYLYVDNFMFSRHTEKQQVINFLFQHNPLGAPTVLPIIGDYLVGKKTLVAHAYKDEKVHNLFSKVLHLNGDTFRTIDHEGYPSARTLVVITLVSDIDDEDWNRFYKAVTCINKGNKVIILSTTESLLRFGTTKPIYLNSLSPEEYSYLFKTLAFGSANPEDHPKLTLVAREFATMLRGSFVGAYSVTNLLRKNINLQFWLSMLRVYENIAETNFLTFGEDLVARIKRRCPVHFKILPCSTNSSVLLLPARSQAEILQRQLPKVRIGDLVMNPAVRPKGDFDLVTWESRIAPYREFVYFVPSYTEENSKGTTRKRGATTQL